MQVELLSTDRVALTQCFASSLSMVALLVSEQTIEMMSVQDISSIGEVSVDSKVTCFCFGSSIGGILLVGDSKGFVHFVDCNTRACLFSKCVSSDHAIPVAIACAPSSPSTDSLFVLLDNGSLFCATGLTFPSDIPSFLKPVTFSVCKTVATNPSLLPWSAGVVVADGTNALVYHVDQRNRIQAGPRIPSCQICLGVNSKGELLSIDRRCLVFSDVGSGEETWRMEIAEDLESAIFREISSQVSIIIGKSAGKNSLSFYSVRDSCVHAGDFQLPSAGGRFAGNFFIQPGASGLDLVKLGFPDFQPDSPVISAPPMSSNIWQTPKQISRSAWKEAEIRGIEKAHDAVHVAEVTNFAEIVGKLSRATLPEFLNIFRDANLPSEIAAAAILDAMTRFGLSPELVKVSRGYLEISSDLKTRVILGLLKNIYSKCEALKSVDFSSENFQRVLPALLPGSAEVFDLAEITEFADPADVGSRFLAELANRDDMQGFETLIDLLDERNLLQRCAANFLSCGFDSKFSEKFPGFTEEVEEAPKNGILDCPEDEIAEYLSTMEKVSLARNLAALADPPAPSGIFRAWNVHEDLGHSLPTAQEAAAAAVSSSFGDKIISSIESAGYPLLVASLTGKPGNFLVSYFQQICETSQTPDVALIYSCLRYLPDVDSFLSKNCPLATLGNFQLLSQVSQMAGRLNVEAAPPTKRAKLLAPAPSQLERVARCAATLHEYSVPINWNAFSADPAGVGKQLLPLLAKNSFQDFSIVQNFCRDLEISKCEAMIFWLEEALQRAPFSTAAKIFREFSQLAPEIAGNFIQNCVIPKITDLSRISRCLTLVPDQLQISRFTCLAMALEEFEASTGRTLADETFHSLRCASPEKIEAAVSSYLYMHPTLDDFWASEKFLARLGYGGDGLKFKAILSGKFSVPDLQEISRSIEDLRKLRECTETVFRRDRNMEISAWLRKLDISDTLRKEIDTAEFFTLWSRAGFAPCDDPISGMNILFWGTGPFPSSQLFWDLARLSQFSEKSILVDFGVACIESPPRTSPGAEENIDSIFARPEIDRLSLARASLIAGAQSCAGRERFFKRILKVAFSENSSTGAKCRAFDAVFSIARVSEISRVFGSGIDDLCEMRAACMFMRAMEQVKHFMNMKEFVLADKSELAKHLLSLNKRSSEVMQIVAALVIDYDLWKSEEIIGAVRDCLILQGKSAIVAEIKKSLIN